jgi:tetratricopeptide (TPR) repeat protein
MVMNQQRLSRTELAGSGTTAAFDPETATATELLFAGLQIARAGAFDEAAEIFAKAILKEPESAEAYEALATVLVPLGKVEFACRAKGKAISLGYDSARSWEMLGDMLMSLGKFEDAAEAFRCALARDPAALQVIAKLDAAMARRSPAVTPLPSAAAPSHARAEADLFGPEFLSPEPVPQAWRQINIVTVVPDGNPHTAAFDDLASGFESAFRSLGITVEKRNNAISPSGVNLLLGAHLIGTQEFADRIPSSTVVVNLEQIWGFDVRARPIYLGLLKRLAVWDYSVRNIVELRRMTQNPNIRHFSVGHVPEMTRNFPASAQPIDVLFYGSINERRRVVLQGLADAGLKVRHLFSVYGEERDRVIAEAKIVLNLHFYEDSIHEIVRTSYLLANSKAVVSECGPKTEIDEDIRQAMIAVPYSDLVSSCVALVRDEPRRHALERRAFEIFAKRDQAKILRDTIAATELPEGG